MFILKQLQGSLRQNCALRLPSTFQTLKTVKFPAINPDSLVQTSGKRRPLPEELVNASLAEGAPEESEFHLASVDGGHGGVAESTDPQRGLQVHLSARLSPEPADGRRRSSDNWNLL